MARIQFQFLRPKVMELRQRSHHCRSQKRKESTLLQDPYLVSLLSDLELNDEIPDNLYVAVAIILSWAYWLKDIEPDKRD